jgi:Flp pilus assembly pilin Flp
MIAFLLNILLALVLIAAITALFAFVLGMWRGIARKLKESR